MNSQGAILPTLRHCDEHGALIEPSFLPGLDQEDVFLRVRHDEAPSGRPRTAAVVAGRRSTKQSRSRMAGTPPMVRTVRSRIRNGKSASRLEPEPLCSEKAWAVLRVLLS